VPSRPGADVVEVLERIDTEERVAVAADRGEVDVFLAQCAFGISVVHQVQRGAP